jgi:hypothetical protein
MTEKSRKHVFKFLTLLKQPMENTLNLHGIKQVCKPRSISVVFSQFGSEQHGSASHQKWLQRVLRNAVYPMQWMGLMMVCFGMAVKDVRSECEEDKGTDCKNGDSDTDW